MNSIEGKQLIELGRFTKERGVGFAVRQTTHAFCEEGLDLDMNVTPYGMLKKGEVIYDAKFGSEIALNPKVEFGREEIEGMENMFSLVEDGCDLVYWISPSGGSYKDARLVVAIKKESVEGVEVECRGIAIDKSPSELLQICMNMVCFENGKMESWANNPEGLRSQPIGIELNGRDWIDFSERMFSGMFGVWEAIRKGIDVELRDKIEAHVRAVYEEVFKSGLIGRRMDEAFERGMEARGYRLNPMGNHGGSVLTAKHKGGVFNNIYSEGGKTRVDSFGNIQHYCEACGCWYTGDKCPLCGRS